MAALLLFVSREETLTPPPACRKAMKRSSTSHCRYFWKRTFPKYLSDVSVIRFENDVELSQVSTEEVLLPAHLKVKLLHTYQPLGKQNPAADVITFPLPSESSWPGLGTSRQLSGPGGFSSGIPSLSSSSSHSSPSPSLSVSTWELLGTEGQLSLVSWWPSPSLGKKMHCTAKELPLTLFSPRSLHALSSSWDPLQEQGQLVIWPFNVLSY